MMKSKIIIARLEARILGLEAQVRALQLGLEVADNVWHKHAEESRFRDDSEYIGLSYQYLASHSGLFEVTESFVVNRRNFSRFTWKALIKEGILKPLKEETAQILSRNLTNKQLQNLRKSAITPLELQLIQQPHDGQYLLSAYKKPAGILSGDYLGSYVRPDSRNLVGILGDYTGHGVGPAIMALDTISIFYGMARRGCCLDAIAEEIALKVLQRVPLGFFSDSIFFEFMRASNELYIGGHGGCYIYSIKLNGEVKPLSSEATSMGMDALLSLPRFHTVPVYPGDSLFMSTDGLIDQRDYRGERFGRTRLEKMISLQRLSTIYGAHATMFEHIVKNLRSHQGTEKQNDDITFAQVTLI